MSFCSTCHSHYGPRPSLSRERRVWLRAAAGAALGAALAGCASKPVTSTPLELTFSVAAGVNPDANGRASPLTLRVYALKSPSAFQSADFFSLFERDSATLGADLVQREELLLIPGQSQALTWSLPLEAKTLAVLAAYRELERSRWRAVHALTVGKAQRLEVRCEARSVTLDPVK